MRNMTERIYLDGAKTRKFFYGSGKTRGDIANAVECSPEYLTSLINPGYCMTHSVGIETASRLAKEFGTTLNEIRLENPVFARTKYGELIEAWMQYAGIEQSELANKAGIYNDNLRNIINGATRQPRIGTINRIANALGVTYTRFMAGPSAEEEKPKETVLPYDTEVDEPAEETGIPENKYDATPRVQVLAAADAMPEWLKSILREEIMDAHAGFKSSAKAADKKCYASVVLMHAALYTRFGSH